ncbi:hypothetical protein T459_04017 [Capsicum annuum]|uniref:AT-hook motif nuclear-localized protein n=1 Tax=Capsicum annuum TaxID=4072 RepID=A0A2G3APH4_CAPAN|nr:hypothetical protein T459_04017 [Capsicum annuum]
MLFIWQTISVTTQTPKCSEDMYPIPTMVETFGSPIAAVGAIAEPSKKKRGRPRKIVGDGRTGITGATSSGNSSKKAQLTLARGPGAQNGNGPGSDTMSRMDLGPNSTSKASSRAKDYPSPYMQTTSPLLKISTPEYERRGYLFISIFSLS